MGPRVLSWGIFEYCLVLTIPCPFSALNEQKGPNLPMWWLGDRVSLALGLAVPCPQRWGTRPLGMGPLWALLGLGLAPRRPIVLS